MLFLKLYYSVDILCVLACLYIYLHKWTITWGLAIIHSNPSWVTLNLSHPEKRILKASLPCLHPRLLSRTSESVIFILWDISTGDMFLSVNAKERYLYYHCWKSWCFVCGAEGRDWSVTMTVEHSVYFPPLTLYSSPCGRRWCPHFTDEETEPHYVIYPMSCGQKVTLSALYHRSRLWVYRSWYKAYSEHI